MLLILVTHLWCLILHHTRPLTFHTQLLKNCDSNYLLWKVHVEPSNLTNFIDLWLILSFPFDFSHRRLWQWCTQLHLWKMWSLGLTLTHMALVYFVQRYFISGAWCGSFLSSLGPDSWTLLHKWKLAHSSCALIFALKLLKTKSCRNTLVILSLLLMTLMALVSLLNLMNMLMPSLKAFLLIMLLSSLSLKANLRLPQRG